jgi:adenine-specific DNA-methyltransferase
MPRAKLEEVINNFKIEDFTQFFRLKNQAQGNFRLSNERLLQYNDSDFSGLIKLGQIEYSATEKLIVIGAEVEKDLSERSGKKNQYEKAKKILKELAVYSAGIFIFYDASGSFRFSLVYPEAVGRRREWSSYFVSKELTNKTFLQRIGDGDFSTLEKIKDAFSVEKVTKEFYLEYRKLFDSLIEDLSKNHTFINEASKNQINIENFAKKLLGQIVFLYFIQKKGWLGVPTGKRWGEGDKNFMGNIYKAAMSKKANFYND